MGQAFDRDGRILGEEYGETKREVLDKLQNRFPDAEEIRIRTNPPIVPDLGNTTGPTQSSAQVPSIGRIVHYHLSAEDAIQINRRRTTGASIAERMKYGDDPQLKAWPAEAQAHIGNAVMEGDAFPMLIVRVWGQTAESAVNGQVFLDGNDVFWATSRTVGVQPGTFSWPTRV